MSLFFSSDQAERGAARAGDHRIRAKARRGERRSPEADGGHTQPEEEGGSQGAE